MPPQNQQNSTAYTNENIKYLEPREHVRLRPGMYIGGTDKRALHHMVWEIMDNAIEEAMHGNCDKILVQLLPNRNICIEDNSAGLPVHIPSEDEGKPLAELMMTTIRPKSSFEGSYYGVTGGLHGVGLFVVNTLSSDCQVEIKRDGFLWRQTYSEGLATSTLEPVRRLEATESTGTIIRFKPDFQILEENDFDFELIANRCQELAYLLPQLVFTVQDKRETEREEIFHYPNGLLDWLNIQTENELTVHPPLVIRHITELNNQTLGTYKVGLDLAFQYIEGGHTIERSFINTVPIAEGGSHLEGLKNGLKKRLSSDKLKLSKRTIMRGLVVAMSLRHPDPQFGSPTRTILMNTDVQMLIEKTIEALFAAHPEAKASIQSHFEQT